ncbi:MAG: prepilin-type N-terminal cleavage/methylation domain-containing protein, partial [Bacilli bacterium]|nr:prepilin-type N-terminal cleavage/methylation domain-containing protein [Bacilli bacterium]
MNNKKGFTLIELLAVIVILAIIALIATPIILNMINDAKKSAAKDSIFGYVEAVENYQTLQMLKNEDGLVKGK